MLQENQIPQGMDAAQVQKLLASPQAKALLQLLNRDGGAALQQAVQRFQAGDVVGAQAAVSGIMADPQAQALVDQLNQRR